MGPGQPGFGLDWWPSRSMPEGASGQRSAPRMATSRSRMASSRRSFSSMGLAAEMPAQRALALKQFFQVEAHDGSGVTEINASGSTLAMLDTLVETGPENANPPATRPEGAEKRFRIRFYWALKR